MYTGFAWEPLKLCGYSALKANVHVCRLLVHALHFECYLCSIHFVYTTLGIQTSVGPPWNFITFLEENVWNVEDRIGTK